MRSTRHRLRLSVATVVSACLLVSAGPAALAQEPAADRLDRPLPEQVEELRLKRSRSIELSRQQKVSLGLRAARGAQQVVVRLSRESVAEVAAAGRGRAAQRRQLNLVQAQQRQVITAARDLDAGTRVLGRTQKALNAVMLRIDAADIEALAAHPAVVSINPVVDYELDLSETVPYIGAPELHATGLTGAGIRVAVVDSGVDYHHAHLGGSGDPADYAANDPTVVEPGSFPTAKVVGGFDFIGAQWPAGPLAPDPDPLDDGPQAGHGTHVADIIAGTNGVAPDASVYAVKVCSSISTSCSGVALLNALDFAIDPNGDSDTGDHVDIINMSLGAPYGQAFDDDLSQAVENASAVGVLTVASAGNSSDKPYVTGSPAAAPSALSVAQTHVPSAVQPLMEIVSPASIAGQYPAIHQPWSAPLDSLVQGDVFHDSSSTGTRTGCRLDADGDSDLSQPNPFAAGSLTGKVVLVDRGSCTFSEKIANIADAGGVAGIIGLVAPGEPFGGGLGDCPGDACDDIPGFMISQANANLIKSQLAGGVVIKFDPSEGLPLVGHMVGSSSRGPSMLSNRVKPEIGAPGASVSAVAGSGTGTEAFGGTSGAAPMVSGSAALLLQAHGPRNPHEIKSLLMNTAETDIMNVHEFFGGHIAPISRIGGGEVRVDRAHSTPAAAWDSETLSGALSFGFVDASDKTTKLSRWVVVRNYSNSAVIYAVSSNFRFANDRSNGAVKLSAPRRVRVPANGSTTFKVDLLIDAAKLRPWTLNSGSRGANPAPLTLLEYDGYLWLDDLSTAADNDDPLHLAWHVLPRRAGDVEMKAPDELLNKGASAANVESYSLLATSPDLPEGAAGGQSPTPDLRRVGVQTYPVPAGFCSANASFITAFAINTWERQTHAVAPASFFVWIDTDQDGTDDYLVLNRDLTLNSISDGRNVSWVVNLAAGTASAFFFTDHDTNSGNTVLLLCGEQIGMNADDFFDPMDVTFEATDFYFGGPGDDVPTQTISPLGERYFGLVDGDIFATIPAKSTATFEVIDFGGAGTNPDELGVLLLFRDGTPVDNEALEVHLSP